MARLTYDIVDGKAIWGDRTLAEWVPDAVRTIVAGFEPRRVNLFGSVASRKDTPDSDLDFLVVFDRIHGRKRDLATAIQRALIDLGAPVDLLVTDLERRAHLPGILRVALDQGRVVYERAAGARWTRRWLKLAREYLKLAADPDVARRGACLWAHQSAEKARNRAASIGLDAASSALLSR